MAVAIPLVEPKDWHYPRVLSGIISPYIPLLYTPIYCCAVLCCVVCVCVIIYVLYTYVYIYMTQTHRDTDPIPLYPYTPITSRHNTINITNIKINILCLFKVNLLILVLRNFLKIFLSLYKDPTLKSVLVSL